MGVLDSLVGGDISAEFVRVVEGFIQKQGGVAGLVRQFEKQGLGPVIQSWVGKGANHPISAEQIHRALGYEALQQLGAKLGLSPDEMAAKLSKVLPRAIEKIAAEGSRTTSRWGRR